MKTFISLILAYALLLSAVPCQAKPALNVGSKRFTESYVLGEIVTQLANTSGEVDAVHKQGLGNTGIVFAALRSGAIDIYPEYTGTIAEELLKIKGGNNLAAINTGLNPMGLTAGVPLGFNDTYALAMRDDQAQKLGIRTLSDLSRHPELRVGLSQEFLTRADGWVGLKQAYRMPFASPTGIDHGLAYEAISNAQIDVTDIYSTDAKIEKYKLRVLVDDRKFFPAYDAVLLYKSDLPNRDPKTWALIARLRNAITAAQMVHMNADAELHHLTFPEIAANFLQRSKLVTPTGKSLMTSGNGGFLSRLFAPDLGTLTAQHLTLVFLSLAFSILCGIPLGIAAARFPRWSGVILGAVGLIQTVPSIALLVFLIALLRQIGSVPALVALFLYGLLPIVRNTYTGLLDIPIALRESAVALGLSPWARLRLIELPLARRAIMAGIKTSAIINVGTATIAAFVGAGGYGERIVAGLAIDDNATLLAGAVPAAVLALVIQGAFDLLDRWIIPAGLRPTVRE